MGEPAGRYSLVSRLWAQHRAASFPARLRGAVPDGVDMVLLDADAAGCALTWMDSGGQVDENRHQILLRLLNKLDRVVPLVSDPYGLNYFTRLRDLARLVSLPITSHPGPLPG